MEESEVHKGLAERRKEGRKEKKNTSKSEVLGVEEKTKLRFQKREKGKNALFHFLAFFLCCWLCNVKKQPNLLYSI